MSGWICLHRSLLDHILWTEKPFSKGQAWVDLIMLASHRDTEYMANGRVIKVLRGQTAFSQVSFQKRWGWSQNKVRRYFFLLKNERMVDIKTNEQTTIITICNYESFQGLHDNTKDQTKEQVDDQTKDIQQYNNKTNIEYTLEGTDNSVSAHNAQKREKTTKKNGTRFVKPSLDEIATYCAERKNTVSPAVFFEHYESVGWKVGKVPMKDWKARVRYWERSERPQTTTRKLSAPELVDAAYAEKRRNANRERDSIDLEKNDDGVWSQMDIVLRNKR